MPAFEIENVTVDLYVNRGSNRLKVNKIERSTVIAGRIEN